MRFLSLFSGIGGFDLGLEWAGMTCAGQVEIDPYCNAVLEYHWPNVKRVKDIHDVRGDEFGAVDLVCGGFPCQPFSLAGKRKGKKDDRYLWPEMLRVIKATEPAWVLGENVAGIVGVELDKVYADLEGAGYDFPRNLDGKPAGFVIPACGVDAPHRRDRVWIVAHAASSGSLSGTFSEVHSGEKSTGPRHEKLERYGYVADSRCGSGEGPGSSERGSEISARWFPEPNVGRVVDGIPNRVAQLRALGNAVVPQVVAEIGKAIMLADKYHA